MQASTHAPHGQSLKTDWRTYLTFIRPTPLFIPFKPVMAYLNQLYIHVCTDASEIFPFRLFHLELLRPFYPCCTYMYVLMTLNHWISSRKSFREVYRNNCFVLTIDMSNGNSPPDPIVGFGVWRSEDFGKNDQLDFASFAVKLGRKSLISWKLWGEFWCTLDIMFEIALYVQRWNTFSVYP